MLRRDLPTTTVELPPENDDVEAVVLWSCFTATLVCSVVLMWWLP